MKLTQIKQLTGFSLNESTDGDGKLVKGYGLIAFADGDYAIELSGIDSIGVYVDETKFCAALGNMYEMSFDDWHIQIPDLHSDPVVRAALALKIKNKKKNAKTPSQMNFEELQNLASWDEFVECVGVHHAF